MLSIFGPGLALPPPTFVYYTTTGRHPHREKGLIESLTNSSIRWPISRVDAFAAGFPESSWTPQAAEGLINSSRYCRELVISKPTWWCSKHVPNCCVDPWYHGETMHANAYSSKSDWKFGSKATTSRILGHAIVVLGWLRYVSSTHGKQGSRAPGLVMLYASATPTPCTFAARHRVARDGTFSALPPSHSRRSLSGWKMMSGCRIHPPCWHNTLSSWRRTHCQRGTWPS